jgi:hypothetical protein
MSGRVAGVQADGRLVEHIERAHQPRAERSGKLNALRLAAGERRGEAVEGEVFEADRIEKTEALADLFEDRAGNLLLHGRELSASKNSLAWAMVSAVAWQIFLPVDATRCAPRPSTLAAAIGALGIAAILAEHDAHMQLVLLALHLRKEAVDAGKAALAAQHGLARRLEAIRARARRAERPARRLLAQIGEPGAVFGAVPGVDGAVVEAEAFVGNDQVQVEVHGVAEALAARTGAERDC